MLGIVQRVIAGWLADQAGIDRASAQCGAVTLIQRFGSALNLNIHFHMLWLDGVYVEATELPRRELRLHRARAPTTAQLTQLAATIAHRVCRHLTRKGWLEGEGESAFLADSAAGDDSMDGLRMSSITYRIATGRDAGCKVVTLQTLPGDAGSLEGEAGKVGGFSLHAGVAAEAHESHKLEKLCRYITRPAISEKRLSIALQGRVRYQLKTPWRNGTTHVEWDPVDFIAKLAALVPPPRAHLTRFHGVFAPNANLRAQLTPSGRGKRPAGDAAPVDVSAHDAPCGASPASRNPPPSAPSSPTSRSTARGKKRTTGPQRARRQCKPRDDLPAAQPTAKPESEPMRPRSAGRRSARCRESAKHGC